MNHVLPAIYIAAAIAMSSAFFVAAERARDDTTRLREIWDRTEAAMHRTIEAQKNTIEIQKNRLGE